MSFPYPENPNDWQTAYTREHAHRDSDRYGKNLILPIVFCFLILLAYVYLHTMPFRSFETYSPLMRVGLTITILLLFFLLFIIIVFIPASHFAFKFFTEFYCPPNGIDSPKIINYRLFGISKLPPPLNMFSQFSYIIAKDGEIDKKDKWPAWSARNLGGPLNLIVFDGNALYLERGNRFSRVVGPGEKIPFLEWYETIKYVVDLRPKVKTDTFDVWTKDGIKIKLEVQIECRIGDPSKNDPINGIVYPYDPIAVKKAVERFSLRWPNRQEGEPSEFTWVDAAWGQVTGIVPGYIGGRMLDDLFIANRHAGQILSSASLEEVKDKLNQASNNFGVFITDFQILKVDIPEEVHEHQKEHWKAERQSIATIIDGETKAFNIRTHEKVRADTQRDLILAIAEGLEKNKDGQFSEPLLLSFSGVLDESLKDPLTRAYLAKETLETLEQLRKMLDFDQPPQPLEPLDENNGI
jgi:regulator of protease activity HflC (stomatin/prohibitin superfamily)